MCAAHYFQGSSYPSQRFRNAFQRSSTEREGYAKEKEMLYPNLAHLGVAGPMKLHRYDIVRKDGETELAAFWAGEFQVMDQQNHQLVVFWPSSESVNESDSDDFLASDCEELRIHG